MMVLGRCSRQRVSRIGARTRLPKQRLQAIFFPEGLTFDGWRPHAGCQRSDWASEAGCGPRDKRDQSVFRGPLHVVDDFRRGWMEFSLTP